MTPRAIGLAWFREDDYPALLEIFTDSDKMHKEWKDWLQGAQKMEQKAKTEFGIVERVYIDPLTFPDWCGLNKCGVDREGRHKFVGLFIAEKYKTQG